MTQPVQKKTDKKNGGAPSPTTSIRDNQVQEHLLRIFEKDSTFSAWLKHAGKNDGDLYLIAADRLSPQEKALLSDASDVVFRPDEDLLQRVAALEKENKHLRSLSLTDGLTGLYNYRFFVKQLEIEITRTRRTGQSCALLMIDLDNFKQLNDTLGHDAGNQYLMTVTEAISSRLRSTDIMCRYGGDEFSVIMPATILIDALHIAERLLEAVRRIPPKLETPFSVSIGVAEYEPSSGKELSDFVNLADRALYRAKKGGKNRICSEGKVSKVGKADSVTVDEKAALLGRKNKD